MKYKQKLKTVEAFHYQGDFKKLTSWFIENSTRALPFFWIGRELQIFKEGGIGASITPGCYVVLSTDGKAVTVMEKKEFEGSHVVVSSTKGGNHGA